MKGAHASSSHRLDSTSADAVCSYNRSAVLYVVVSSLATRHRALNAHYSWCKAARCLFMGDKPWTLRQHTDAVDDHGRPHELSWRVLTKVTRPTRNCCDKSSSASSFFCSAHRRKTLPAQYRFLPALLASRRYALEVNAGWVVMVDDDSYVFTRRLQALLSHHNPCIPQLLGEFKPRGLQYACGGAGTVLSRAALLALDLEGCIARSRTRCAQSDWMLAECARRARVTSVPRYGCGSCAQAPSARQAAVVTRALREGGCQFMQEFSTASAPLSLITNRSCGASSPSIVHGATSDGRSVAALLAAAARPCRRGTKMAARQKGAVGRTRHSTSSDSHGTLGGEG